MWSIFSPQQANKELQDNNDTLFCNPASKQQIRKLKLKYDGKSCTCMMARVVPGKLVRWSLMLLVQTTSTHFLLIRLAKICGYTNLPTTNCGHGNCKYGLSLVCNNNVDISTIKNIAGHAHINTISNYHS